MKTLVLGASGTTGKQVVEQLILKNIPTRILIRTTSNMPEKILSNSLIEVVRGNISQMNQKDVAALIKDCNCIISCLGHNMNLKGLFGKPRNLVSGALEKIYEAIELNKRTGTSDKKVNYVLMNTAGFINTALHEKTTVVERSINRLLLTLLPPHSDNVSAVLYLINTIGTGNKYLDWVAVRPDTLINKSVVTPYTLHDSPTRSPIFNPGKTSRINVAHFISELSTEEKLWNVWKYRTPVMYNQE
jgi:hypothetical protein